MKSEAEVKKEVYDLMERWETCGDILWFERLQSGMIIHYGNHIWLCRDGTPDFICVFINKSRMLSLLFVEVKAENVAAKPRAGAQFEFKERYGMKHVDMEYFAANNCEDVKVKIRSLCYDRLGGIEL